MFLINAEELTLLLSEKCGRLHKATSEGYNAFNCTSTERNVKGNSVKPAGYNC